MVFISNLAAPRQANVGIVNPRHNDGSPRTLQHLTQIEGYLQVDFRLAEPGGPAFIVRDVSLSAVSRVKANRPSFEMASIGRHRYLDGFLSFSDFWTLRAARQQQ